MSTFVMYLALAVSVISLGGCATSGHGLLVARSSGDGKSSAHFNDANTAKTATSAGTHGAPSIPATKTPSASLAVTVEGIDKQLSAALRLEAVQPTAQNYLRTAREYQRLHILDAATEHAESALRLSPQYADAHETLARIWREWGWPERGLGAAYRAVAFAPESAHARNTLGTLLGALGHLPEARAAYERALVLTPHAAWALNNLCSVELRMGRPDEARAHCQDAIRLAPGLTAAHNNLALTFVATGDLARAREAFVDAGDLAAASYNLGIVFLASRDYEAAARAFTDAIHSRPDFTAAKTRAHAARMRIVTGESAKSTQLR